MEVLNTVIGLRERFIPATFNLDDQAQENASKRASAGAQNGAAAVTHARSFPGASNVELIVWFGRCSTSPNYRIIAALSRETAYHADAKDV
ncbi:hypothetical protein [Burkholderia stagnalis]|uniref:hypothetical protein n=1 Tax=Burkholderia stagnalis TaxID=1503054 RepID=UPI0009C03C62|nr:hypothetical protein [Burkholderia stagnalis]